MVNNSRALKLNIHNDKMKINNHRTQVRIKKALNCNENSGCEIVDDTQY